MNEHVFILCSTLVSTDIIKSRSPHTCLVVDDTSPKSCLADEGQLGLVRNAIGDVSSCGFQAQTYLSSHLITPRVLKS